MAGARWDVCFGGVVGAGEDWEDAARRELAEEAGVELGSDGPLELLGEQRYEDRSVREVGRVYRVRSDGPFTFPDGEVAASATVPLGELPGWLQGRSVCPDSKVLVVPRLLARRPPEP